MMNTPSPLPSAVVLPFPRHLARPPLAERVHSIAAEARADGTRLLWDSLPTGNSDRIDADDLCGFLPDGIDLGTRGAMVSAVIAADFAVLGLFAIHTGQWMRPDLLPALMELQTQAERTRALMAPAPATATG